MTRRHRYPVQIPEALVPDAQALAQAVQTSLDDCVRLAMVDKMTAARTAQSVQTRATRADSQAFPAVLEWGKQAAGPVVTGDELAWVAGAPCLCGMAAASRQGEVYRGCHDRVHAAGWLQKETS